MQKWGKVNISTTEVDEHGKMRRRSIMITDLLIGLAAYAWNGDDDFGNSISSGVYLYKLKVNGQTEAVKKCLLLK